MLFFPTQSKTIELCVAWIGGEGYGDADSQQDRQTLHLWQMSANITLTSAKQCDILVLTIKQVILMKTLENCRIQISSGLVRRFHSKVDKHGDDKCWPWKASRNSSGYGWIRINYRLFLAHRISWEIHFGAIPEGKLILHKCNNRSCVNPQHLYIGDHVDNAGDVNKLKLPRHGVKATKAYDIMRANHVPVELSAKGARIIEHERQLMKEL